MRNLIAAASALGLATMAMAGEKRELGSHEHGVGLLNIAFEGERVVMEFEAPGADLVGFEHAPESAEDRAMIDEAIAVLARPLSLFVLPGGAGCSVLEAHAALIGDGAHGRHGEDDHGHGHEHEHEHDRHDHGDEANRDRPDAPAHSAFRAEYVLACADPAAVDRIDFAYFARFPNAREVEVRLISDRGARALNVERGAPGLSLSGAI